MGMHDNFYAWVEHYPVTYIPTYTETDDNTDEELDADVKFSLTEEEAEIRSYLLYDEPLSEDTLEKLAGIFWNNEPYKYDKIIAY